MEIEKSNVNIKLTLVIKYIAMAVIIGIVVGIVDTIFGRGLLAISDFRTANYKYLIPFLPIAGLFIVWMYSYFSKVSLKGMTLVFEAGQNKRDSIPMALVPLVMIGTWITHLFGGSAGREGVAVQIGATLSHYMGRKLKTPDNSRIMLITGMAAGFGGLFQTPLAATFFAMEVIVAGYMDYQALLPAITAAFVASFTSHSLGLEKFSVELNETINMPDDLMAIIVPRTTMNRMGIDLKTQYVNPSYSGKMFLALKNNAPIPIKIYNNTVIGQICFFELQGKPNEDNLYRNKGNKSYQNEDDFRIVPDRVKDIVESTLKKNGRG